MNQEEQTAREELAVETHRRALGRVLYANVLYGLDLELRFDPPVPVRVVPVGRGSITHWNDDYLDPYWDVVVLDRQRREFYMHPRRERYWIDGPTIDPWGRMETPGEWRYETWREKPGRIWRIWLTRLRNWWRGTTHG